MAYTGRCGTIATDVLRLLNDASQGFTKEPDILAWLNLLQCELASEGLWEGYGLINTVASTGTSDLSSITFTGLSNWTFVKLNKLYWIYNGTHQKEIEVSSRERLEEALQVAPTGGIIHGYYLKGTILNFAPVPTTSYTSAMRAWCNVCPPALTGGTPTDNPQTPKAFDAFYVYGCLEEACIKDRTIATRDADIPMYRGLKELWKNKILTSGSPTKKVLKPYRQ